MITDDTIIIYTYLCRSLKIKLRLIWITDIDDQLFPGIQSVADSNGYYNSGPDPRYVAYPPPVQFAQPPLIPQPPSLRANVPPPDVTVLGAPGPHLTTFYGGPLETEGHLVWCTLPRPHKAAAHVNLVWKWKCFVIFYAIFQTKLILHVLTLRCAVYLCTIADFT